MTEVLLTICITNYNTSDFIINTLNCLKKITKNQYKVIIRDNTSEIKDYLKLTKYIKNLKNVELFRRDICQLISDDLDMSQMGSWSHGDSLNEMISRVTSQYAVIIDSDFTFLYKDWDEILINQIDRTEYPIIGTQSEWLIERRPNDFPCIYGILFFSDLIKTLNIDLRPQKFAHGKDTGYQLREKFLEGGYKGKLIQFKNTRFYKEGPFRHLTGVGEYYMEGTSGIFATHFGRGASPKSGKYYSKYKKYIIKIPVVGSYVGDMVLQIKYEKEKRKWLNTCRQIAIENSKKKKNNSL